MNINFNSDIENKIKNRNEFLYDLKNLLNKYNVELVINSDYDFDYDMYKNQRISVISEGDDNYENEIMSFNNDISKYEIDLLLNN